MKLPPVMPRNAAMSHITGSNFTFILPEYSLSFPFTSYSSTCNRVCAEQSSVPVTAEWNIFPLWNHSLRSLRNSEAWHQSKCLALPKPPSVLTLNCFQASSPLGLLTFRNSSKYQILFPLELHSWFLFLYIPNGDQDQPTVMLGIWKKGSKEVNLKLQLQRNF